MVDGFLLGYVALHALLAAVEADLAGAGAHVAVVGVGHLAGAVDDAAHDGYLEALHLAGGRLDARYGGAQVVEGAPAARATDILRAADPLARGLEDRELEREHSGGRHAVGLGGLRVEEAEAIDEAVEEQRTRVGRALYLDILLTGLVGIVTLAEDHRIGDALTHERVDDGACLAERIARVAADDEDGDGVIPYRFTYKGSTVYALIVLDPAQVYVGTAVPEPGSAGGHGLTLDVLADIKTAVSEAVTNAIVHGYEDETGLIVITASLRDDGILEVSVADTGKGIADISRAMQPFFTTQPEKERSGMGFSVMQTFMDRVTVESALGRGTTVRMQKRLREA